MKYICLLRGVNVGGNKKVPMSILKAFFLSSGFSKVSTILNTGTVVFQSEKEVNEIHFEVEKLLVKHFDFQIPSLVFSAKELMEFAENKKVKEQISSLDKKHKVLFTFANDLKPSEIKKLKESNDLELIDSNQSILCICFSIDRGTPIIMKVLDEVLGKRGTSRNLNTVTKIVREIEKV